MLTPLEIHNREFKKGFRGYNEAEVDEFLDKVVVDYEKALRDNEKLRDMLTLHDKEVENYKKLEKNLQDTLSVAQKTADEVLESAKKTAKEIRESAVRDTQSIYNNTIQETQNMRDQAQIESKRILDDAAHKLRVIITEYDKIVREKTSFLLKFRTALESELAVTSQLLSALPHLDELSEIKSELTRIELKSESAPVEEEIVEENEPEELIEKVSQVVAKAEPLETEKVSVEKVTTKKISAKKVVDSTEENESIQKSTEEIADDLEKTMTYKPIKKSAE